MKIQEIEINKIEDNPYQNRKKIEDKPLKILAKSIRERGLFNPISVLKEGDRYIIISGHRRMQAFKRLRRKVIPAIVKSRQKNKELIIDLVHENLIREDLTPIEKANSIRLLFSQIKSTDGDPKRMCTLIGMLKNWKRRGYIPKHNRGNGKGFGDNDIFQLMEILKSIGVSENNAVTYLNLLGLPSYITDEIIYNKRGFEAKGKLVLKQAEQLSRVKDQEYQKYLYNRCIEGSTVKHIQALVDLHITKVEKGEWKGMDKKTYSAKSTFKDGLRILEKLSEKCHILSANISSFKVDTLIALEVTLEKEDFIAHLTDLQKELRLLDNRISEKLEERGYVEVKDPLALEPFEISVKHATTKKHFRYTIPMKVCKSLGLSKEKPNFLKLKIVGIRK